MRIIKTDELIDRLTGKTEGSPDAIMSEINTLQDEFKALKTGGSIRLRGIGIFTKTETGMDFNPDRVLELELNHQYAGNPSIILTEGSGDFIPKTNVPLSSGDGAGESRSGKDEFINVMSPTNNQGKEPMDERGKDIDKEYKKLMDEFEGGGKAPEKPSEPEQLENIDDPISESGIEDEGISIIPDAGKERPRFELTEEPEDVEDQDDKVEDAPIKEKKSEEKPGNKEETGEIIGADKLRRVDEEDDFAIDDEDDLADDPLAEEFVSMLRKMEERIGKDKPEPESEPEDALPPSDEETEKTPDEAKKEEEPEISAIAPEPENETEPTGTGDDELIDISAQRQPAPEKEKPVEKTKDEAEIEKRPQVETIILSKTSTKKEEKRDFVKREPETEKPAAKKEEPKPIEPIKPAATAKKDEGHDRFMPPAAKTPEPPKPPVDRGFAEETADSGNLPRLKKDDQWRPTRPKRQSSGMAAAIVIILIIVAVALLIIFSDEIFNQGPRPTAQVDPLPPPTTERPVTEPEDITETIPPVTEEPADATAPPVEDQISEPDPIPETVPFTYGLRGEFDTSVTDFTGIVLLSIGNRNSADRMARDLAQQGIRSHVYRFVLQDGRATWRVVAGQFANTDAATAAVSQLPSQYRNSFFITRIQL